MSQFIGRLVEIVNSWGESYWNFASVMFVQVIILTAALLILDLLLRRKVRAVVRYWIWLLVLVKLLLPTSFRTPASVAYWFPAGEAAAPMAVAGSPPADDPMLAAAGQTGIAPVSSKEYVPVDSHDAAQADPAKSHEPDGRLPELAAAADPVASPGMHASWKGIILCAWLAIVAALLTVLWSRGRKVRAIVNQAAAAPLAIEALLTECLPAVAMSPGQVQLKISDRLASPAICGFFKPTILLPRRGLELLDQEQSRLIFLHELLHWKRGDLQVNFLKAVLQILYFYNPAVWLAGVMVQRVREQAVDETVLVMRRNDAERYAAMLVDLAAVSLESGEATLRLIGVVESRTALAGRIKRIIGRPIPGSAKLGLSGLAAIVAIGFIFVPMARSERPAAKITVAATDADTTPADKTSDEEASDMKTLNDQTADETTPGAQPTGVETNKPATTKSLFSGRIADPAGVPVTDAIIKLVLDRGGRQITGKTDEEGRFAIGQIDGASIYRIEVESKRCIGIEYRDGVQVDMGLYASAVRNFTLPLACRLQLDVVDEEGAPIRGVWAYSRLTTEPAYRYHDGGATNKQGKLLVGGLKPDAGQQRLIALRSDDYACDHLDIMLDDPMVVVERKVVLKKGHSVRGKALCSDGKPAAGWRILAMPVWWKLGISPMGQTIEPDGSFELPHVANERYDVIISIPTGEGGSTPKTVLTNVELPVNDKPLEVTIDYPSPGGMTQLAGHIEYSGPELERGIHVMAYSRPGNVHVSTFVKPGQKDFELGPMPPGIYTIDFDSTEIEENQLNNIVVPSKPLNVKIVVRGNMALSGSVVDGKSGDPVRTFSVQVTKQRSLRGPNFVQDAKWHEVESDQGAFAVTIVGPGLYTLNVAADGYAPASLDQINTDTDLAKNLKISLEPGQSLQGIVVDENGQPVDDARVATFLPGGLEAAARDTSGDDPGTVRTDAGGEFAIANFAFGKQGLQITHPKFAVALLPSVALPTANAAEPLKFALQRGARVEGHVYDELGQPVANTLIYLNRHNYREHAPGNHAAELATVVTDPSGFYQVDHLPVDDCRLSRAESWTTFGLVRQMIRTQNGKTQIVDFGGSTKTTGRLVVNGRPLAGVKLLISGSSPITGPLMARGQIDGGGNFDFRGIPAGQRALYYTDSEASNQWILAKTFDLPEQGIELGTIELATTTLSVRCEGLKTDPQQNVQLTLQKYDPRWPFGMNIGILQPRRGPDDPFVFQQVLPGKYELVCHRPGRFSVRQVIEVTTAAEQSVDLKLPAGTASLSGTCDKSICGSDGCRSLKVWSRDQRLLGSIVPQEDGTYRLENIPAGEYLIRRFDTRDADVILTVTLTEGESKPLDISPADVSAKSTQPHAARFVFIYTPEGRPLPGCQFEFPGAADPPQLSSAQDGRVVFVGNVGQYEMTITYPGFKTVRQPLALKLTGEGPVPEADLLRIFLEPE